MFQTVKVKSSAIKEVGYDKDTQTLRIVFQQGTEYDYPQISFETYEGLINAKSVGRFYNQHIRVAAKKV
jgi:hypothetical protein